MKLRKDKLSRPSTGHGLTIRMPDGDNPPRPITDATPDEVANAVRLAAESAAKSAVGTSGKRQRRLLRLLAPPRRTWARTDEVIDPDWD